MNPRPYQGNGGTIVGDGGTDGGGDGGPTDDCSACIGSRCSSQVDACNRNAACVQIRSCADFNCAPSDDACVQSFCFPSAPSGQNDYRNLIACNRGAACSTCRTQCQAYVTCTQ
ncbi:hypothetical protein [Pendulispora albinea]|uniref:Uncharacterized protein n=1 Tax=Pendulispora albinea TaxID=2741071 RepID=A0ABZ2LR27_9BACT